MNENAAVVNGLSLLVLIGCVTAWAAILGKLVQRQSPVAFSPRLNVPWRGAEVLLLATTYMLVEVLAAGLAHAWAAELPKSAVPIQIAAISLAHVAWFVFALVFLVVRGAYVDDLGWDSAHFYSDLKIGGWLFLAATVPVMLVQLFFTQFLDIPSQHPLLELTKETPSVGILVLATVAAVGIAPWFEEFVFRVVLQGWLEAEQVRLRKLRDPEADERPGYAPLVIASVVFAGMHAAAGPDPAAIFVLSLFLGYAYRQTHRIAPSIVIHTGVNGWTMLNVWLLYLGEQPAQ